MKLLPSDRSRNFADEMDVIEDAITAENLKKAALIDAMRDAFRQADFAKAEIAVEVAKLRGAIGRRRALRVDPKKAAKAAEKAEGIDIYFDAITETPRARTRERSISAPITPHDHITGEVIETEKSALPHPGAARVSLELAVSDSADSSSFADRGDDYAAGNVTVLLDPTAAGGSPASIPQPSDIGELGTSSCGATVPHDEMDPREEQPGLSWSYGSQSPDRQKPASVPGVLCASSDAPQETPSTLSHGASDARLDRDDTDDSAALPEAISGAPAPSNPGGDHVHPPLAEHPAGQPQASTIPARSSAVSGKPSLPPEGHLNASRYVDTELEATIEIPACLLRPLAADRASA